MKYTALISLMVIVTVSSAPVYVDELEDFVTSKEDKNALSRLDDDDYMIRYEKQRQLDAILQRQSPYVQQQYRQAVQRDQSRDMLKRQQWQLQMQQRGFGDIASQIIAIDSDMSISDAEAKQRKQQLKRQLPSSALSGMDYDDDMWSL